MALAYLLGVVKAGLMFYGYVLVTQDALGQVPITSLMHKTDRCPSAQ